MNVSILFYSAEAVPLSASVRVGQWDTYGRIGLGATRRR
jgi:hypothetical protein